MTLARLEMPHRDLHSTLAALLRSNAPPNAALDRLLADYARYHAVLAALAAGFLLAVGVLTVLFWRRFRQAGAGSRRSWSFERWVFFWFTMLGVILSSFLALVLVANVSNARAPRPGLAGSLAMLREPPVGTPTGDRYQAYETWLDSAAPQVPPPVQRVVNARLSWQRPKAVVCTFALVGAAVAALRIWRGLIRRSRGRPRAWHRGEMLRMSAGVGSVFACLVLMLMVMGNTQAAVAPLAMTMFFG